MKSSVDAFSIRIINFFYLYKHFINNLFNPHSLIKLHFVFCKMERTITVGIVNELVRVFRHR